MNEMATCVRCGKPMVRQEAMGLCPNCLLAAGLGSVADGTAPGPAGRFVPPSVSDIAPLFSQLDGIEPLGSGGMGAVYKARQKNLDRMVALKILPPDIGRDPAFAERFVREAKALARLNHPNVVTLYESGQAGDLFFFFMEFVDGVNLGQLLRTGRIAPREALAIVPQICDALQYAHDQGIVHRDIKPENILLDRKGRVKVADFGVAKLVGPAAASYRSDSACPSEGESRSPGPDASAIRSPQSAISNAILGTPPYMAPEQRERPGEVDHRADIYSLGVVFYQMLTGELPDRKIEPPSKKVVVDVRLDEVVLRALERQPERRYQQVSEVKTMVETIAMTSPQGATKARNASAEALRIRDEARRQVKGPAVGLLITALVSPFLPGILIASGRLKAGAWMFWPMIYVLAGATLAAFGALRMKRLESYRSAWAGSIAGCLISFFNLFCLPFAVWAMAVLSRPHVRAAFGQRVPGPAPAAAPPERKTATAVEPPPARRKTPWRGPSTALLMASILLLLSSAVTLFWSQGDQQVGMAIRKVSPDGRCFAMASARHAMRVFGSDRQCYRFWVGREGGGKVHTWDLPFPTSGLATNASGQTFGLYSLGENGRIQWAEDSLSVRFFVLNDVEVAAYTLPGEGRPPATNAPPAVTEVSSGLPSGPGTDPMRGGHFTPWPHSAYAVLLNKDISAEAIATCRNPRSSKVWWKPDGTLLDEPPVDIVSLRPTSSGSRGPPENEFLVCIR